MAESADNGYTAYPVFKGLQKPLEFLGIQGRYIYWAAGTAGGAMVGFIIGYCVLGFLAGLVILVMAVGTGAGDGGTSIRGYCCSSSTRHGNKRWKSCPNEALDVSFLPLNASECFFEVDFLGKICKIEIKAVLLQRQNPPRFPKNSEPGRVFYFIWKQNILNPP